MHEKLPNVLLKSYSYFITIKEIFSNTMLSGDISKIDFYYIYHCVLKDNSYLFIILTIIVMTTLFKFLCQVVEEYIAPSIVYISDALNLSEAMAGVTLIAFSNGAGDVITALVASNTKEGVSYNIGALYGAGLFFMTIVLALTIKYSPETLTVPKNFVYRDIGVYILATICIPLMALARKITWYYSLCMLLLYGLLIVIVAVQNRIKDHQSYKSSQDENKIDSASLLSEETESMVNHRLNVIRRTFTIEDQAKLNLIFRRLFNYVKNRRHVRIKSQGRFGKLLDIIDKPFAMFRRLTILPINHEEYNHIFTVLWPYFGIPFALLAISIPPSLWWLLLIPLTVILSRLFIIFAPEDNRFLPPYFSILIFIGLFNAILWTKLLCTVLINLLTTLGYIFNIPPTYSGITILAIGNAMQDLFTTLAIAKQGHAILAITGGMIGQLFGLLVGFGLSMLEKTLESDEAVSFDLFNKYKLKENALSIIVIAVTLITLVLVFFYAMCNHFKLDNRLANVLLTIYISFLGISSYITINQTTK